MNEFIKVGLIGDIHCQHRTLISIIRFLKNRDLPILCTGDIVDGKGDPNECATVLSLNQTPTVLGNHDNWILSNSMRALPESTSISDLSRDSINFLKSLPRTIAFSTPQGGGLLCHGLGENDMGKLNPDDMGYALEFNNEFQFLQRQHHLRFILCGHTHRRMIKKHKHQFFLNPGSLLPQHESGFQIMDFSSLEVIQYELEREEIREIEKVRLQDLFG